MFSLRDMKLENGMLEAGAELFVTDSGGVELVKGWLRVEWSAGSPTFPLRLLLFSPKDM